MEVAVASSDCSGSSWGDATAESIQTQWCDATEGRGSTTLVAASLGVCSQPQGIVSHWVAPLRVLWRNALQDALVDVAERGVGTKVALWPNLEIGLQESQRACLIL